MLAYGLRVYHVVACCHPDTAADSDLLTVHAPTPLDVEQLRHVAADADAHGAPRTDAELAFLASDQNVLRVDECGDLVVVTWTRNLYFEPPEVRAVIAGALPVWEKVRWTVQPFIGKQPDPPPPFEERALVELEPEASAEAP